MGYLPRRLVRVKFRLKFLDHLGFGETHSFMEDAARCWRSFDTCFDTCAVSFPALHINLKPLQLLTALFEDMSDNPHREGWQDSGGAKTGCFGPKVLLGFIWDQSKRSPYYQIMTFKVISPDGDKPPKIGLLPGFSV